MKGTIAAVAVAVLAFAAGLLATQYWPNREPVGTVALPGSVATSPSPSTDATSDSTTVSLAWDRAEVRASAAGVFTPPPCGHEFSADVEPAHGVEPVANATLLDSDTQPASIEVTTQFESRSADPVHFLADEQLVIVTRDGIVVTPDWGVEFIPALYTAQEGQPSITGAPFNFGPSGLCDVAQEDADFWDGFDWDTATPDEIADADRRAREFHERHSDFPPGVYDIYVWTPVVMGEQAAVARALYDKGVTDLPRIEYTIGYTELVDDPRVMEHCVPDYDFLTNLVGYSCDVPPDTLREVLTLDVPRDYVIDVQVMPAISAPVSITVR